MSDEQKDELPHSERMKHAPKRQFIMTSAGLLDRRAHNFLTIERTDPSPGRTYFTLFLNGKLAIDYIDAQELYARIGVMLGEEKTCESCDGNGVVIHD